MPDVFSMFVQIDLEKMIIEDMMSLQSAIIELMG